jgi:hypothetical protein
VALSPNLTDREKAKFLEGPGGITLVRTSPFSDFGLGIAAGDIPNYSVVHKFGRNSDIDVGLTEDIWDGGNTYPFLTSAATLDVTSDNANDTSAGTGARTVKIIGLDSSYDDLTETVSMNGLTIVTTTASFLRVNRILVLTAGVTGSNEGTISVKDNSTVLGQVKPEINQSLMAVYTVPNATTGFITRFSGSCIPDITGSGFRDGELFLKIRELSAVFQTKNAIGLSSRGNSFIDFDYETPLIAPAKSDIKMSYSAHQNNTKVLGSFEIVVRADG